MFKCCFWGNYQNCCMIESDFGCPAANQMLPLKAKMFACMHV